jgi:hypothetical protein
MSVQIGVYNPDDEELEFKFDGRDYKLAPEDVTMVPRSAVGPMLSQIGEYGVSVVPVGTSKKELGSLVEVAKKRWLEGTRKWAEDILLASSKFNKERVEAGISPIEGPQVLQARSWLKKHGFLAILLLALFLPTLAAAQDIQKVAWSVYGKDVTDTSYSYCKLVGSNGDPFGTANVGRGRIETSGSSTTVTEVTTGDNPFTEIAVGDVLMIQVGSTVYRRNVVARASAASITVDTAIDLSAGYSWSWYQQKCGATAADGWIPVSLAHTMSFAVDWITKNATSLDHSFECRVGGITATVIEQASQSAVGPSVYVLPDGVWDECRIGLKLTTDTGAQNITALIAYKGASR